MTIFKKPRWRGAAGPVATAVATAAVILTTSISAQSEPAGEVVVAQPVLRQQFDPTAMVATTDFLVFDQMYDGLINMGPNGKEPALAKSWEVSEDGKQIDFMLREGVTFHNGDPFTAEDVKFTFERLISEGNTHSYRKAFVDSLDHVEVVGPHQARFVLKKPWPPFFTSARYALQGIAPKKYYESVGADGFQENPVGTGPFKLADMKAGEWTKYEANEDYWGDVPKAKFVTKQLVKEPFTRYAMLERGEADIIMGLTGPLLERIRSNKDITIISSEYSGTSGMYFSKSEFPESKNRAVRLAIGHALNRKEVAENILGGTCDPATSIFTPATFGYLDGLDQIEYDPEKAKQMLKENGIEEGHEISFSIHTESFGSLPNAPQVLEAFAGNLEAIGLKIDRQPLETGAWLAMMRGGKQPGIFYGPSSIPDDGGSTINGWFASWSVWSAGNINVPEYDDIFNRQLEETDMEKREDILQEFAKLEDERREGLPLFWCNTPFAVSKRVASWSPAVGSGYHMKLNLVEIEE
jgi:peptide/nickel transport system substrate-binding protein